MKQLAEFSTWPSQNQQLEALYTLIATDRTPHAILLVGQSEKTKELAEYLAKLLLCTNDDAPCGVCESCRQFAVGSHPDYIAVDGVETGSIKTGQIEEIQSRLSVISHHGGSSVYVLHGVGGATPVAANRLLKTLEEPPAFVKAILTTDHVGKLLPTIRSRLFAYSLDNDVPVQPHRGLSTDSSTEAVKDENLNQFVSSLEPVIKWTYSWLAKREPSLVLAASLLEIDANHAGDVLDTVALWLRELVHVRAGLSSSKFSEYQNKLAEQAPLASLRQFAQAAELVAQAKTRLQAHVAANLNFEQLCIRLRGVL